MVAVVTSSISLLSHTSGAEEVRPSQRRTDQQKTGAGQVT